MLVIIIEVTSFCLSGVISAARVCGQISELGYTARAKFIACCTQLNTRSRI